MIYYCQITIWIKKLYIINVPIKHIETKKCIIRAYLSVYNSISCLKKKLEGNSF